MFLSFPCKSELFFIFFIDVFWDLISQIKNCKVSQTVWVIPVKTPYLVWQLKLGLTLQVHDSLASFTLISVVFAEDMLVNLTEKWQGSSSLNSLIFLKIFFKVHLFLREIRKKQEMDRERGRETQNLKQAPGSELLAQSPMQGSNSQTVRS